MNKYENMYFHGLAGNIIISNADDLIIETSLNQLEQIIKTGGIYSRNKLKEYNIEYIHKPVENGNDYISVCVKNPNEEEFTGYNEGLDSSYNPYIQRNKIALVISDQINQTHIFRNPSETHMLPGERQIKDGISFENISGITIMFNNEESQRIATEKVQALLQEYNIELPLLDQNLNEIESQLKR